MVLSAMNTGVTGLKAEGEAIGVAGDNIANTNTVGFKKQRALFEDILGHSILAGTSSALPGSGVELGKIQQIYTQGTISSTGVSTDLALNGDGFFTVKGTVDGVSSNFFTRAGQFTIDNSGYLVNPNGLNLQGYAANADQTFQASLSSIKVPTSSIQPNTTKNVTVVANLDGAAAAPTTQPWNAQTPATTSNFSTTMAVYDSLGNKHDLDIYFEKVANSAGPPIVQNQWTYHALVNGAELATPVVGNSEVGTGTLQFGTDGSLTSITTGTPISVSFANATAGQAITLNLGSQTGTGGTGLTGLTQFSSPSSVSSQQQDGYSSGDFSGVAVDGTGVVRGLYTNGQKIAIAQLSIAKFRSNDGLGRAGQNLWIDTRESGTPAYGTAGSGGRGSVSSGALEASNVDLAEEFVNLIQHQRSYSANSKTITTADEMLQELIQIKR